MALPLVRPPFDRAVDHLLAVSTSPPRVRERGEDVLPGRGLEDHAGFAPTASTACRPRLRSRRLRSRPGEDDRSCRRVHLVLASVKVARPRRTTYISSCPSFSECSSTTRWPPSRCIVVPNALIPSVAASGARRTRPLIGAHRARPRAPPRILVNGASRSSKDDRVDPLDPVDTLLQVLVAGPRANASDNSWSYPSGASRLAELLGERVVDLDHWSRGVAEQRLVDAAGRRSSSIGRRVVVDAEVDQRVGEPGVAPSCSTTRSAADRCPRRSPPAACAAASTRSAAPPAVLLRPSRTSRRARRRSRRRRGCRPAPRTRGPAGRRRLVASRPVKSRPAPAVDDPELTRSRPSSASTRRAIVSSAESPRATAEPVGP